MARCEGDGRRSSSSAWGRCKGWWSPYQSETPHLQQDGDTGLNRMIPLTLGANWDFQFPSTALGKKEHLASFTGKQATTHVYTSRSTAAEWRCACINLSFTNYSFQGGLNCFLGRKRRRAQHYKMELFPWTKHSTVNETLCGTAHHRGLIKKYFDKWWIRRDEIEKYPQKVFLFCFKGKYWWILTSWLLTQPHW